MRDAEAQWASTLIDGARVWAGRTCRSKSARPAAGPRPAYAAASSSHTGQTVRLRHRPQSKSLTSWTNSPVANWCWASSISPPDAHVRRQLALVRRRRRIPLVENAVGDGIHEGLRVRVGRPQGHHPDLLRVEAAPAPVQVSLAGVPLCEAGRERLRPHDNDLRSRRVIDERGAKPEARCRVSQRGLGALQVEGTILRCQGSIGLGEPDDGADDLLREHREVPVALGPRRGPRLSYDRQRVATRDGLPPVVRPLDDGPNALPDGREIRRVQRPVSLGQVEGGVPHRGAP